MDRSAVNKRFQESINFLIDTKKAKTKGEIASNFGIKPSKFSEILNNRMNAGQDLLTSLSRIYGVSLNWLLTGEGSMISEEEIKPMPIATDAPTSDCLPLIPIEVMAGYNGTDMPGVALSECPMYCVPEFVSAGAQFLIRVSGSSMYPKYNSGDILACRRVPDITFFQWGKVYVIDSCQGAMVKRIFEGQQPGTITCKSDNQSYPPFTLPTSEIRSLSIVIGVIRLE